MCVCVCVCVCVRACVCVCSLASTWLSLCMAKASFMCVNIILYGPYSYAYLLMTIKDIKVEVVLTYPFKQHITTKLLKMRCTHIVAKLINYHVLCNDSTRKD